MCWKSESFSPSSQGLADVKAAMGQVFPGYMQSSHRSLHSLTAQTPENGHYAKVNAVHF